MKGYMSGEVEDNILLHAQEPEYYYLAETGKVYCDCGQAFMLMYKKNVNYTTFTCPKCLSTER